MLAKLALLFTVVVIAELWLLIKLGQYIGLGYTLLVLLATGVLGVVLAKSQGMIILNNIKRDIREGIMPGVNLINGLCVLIGGILLVVPGILTDIIGFLFIVPVTRNIIRKYILKRIRRMIDAGVTNFFTWR
ncbi:MAG TPA: FxsA family protein [Clostridiales bacterium]|nr:FxsA family protein [Clostridiales bacterium]